ncbi:MAG: T9SS type A sorting domain-containing protein [Bacteroidota bacterium]
MKKLIITFAIMIGYKVSFGQFFLIQSSGPVDVCYPATVTLEVSTPQAGYDYNWFIGGFTCPGTGSAGPYAIGPTMQAMITGEYYCMGIPSAGGPPEISNPITVRVLPGAPGSIYMPAPGQSGNFNCVTSASFCIPVIYFQNWPGTIIKWYKNNTLISGATSGSYTATSAGYYKYTITSGCMTAPSDSTLVTTSPSATISANGPTSICSGSSVTFNANSGIGYSYQWKKDLSIISGATNSSYTATAAGNYTVVVTNSCGSATSSGVTVTVNSLPSATITPVGSTTFCTGGSVTLNAPVAASRSYQWKKGANIVSGATSSSYIATSGGNYRVIVTNTITGCSKTTGTATIVTVNVIPTATITPQGPTTFCAGGSVVLKANTGIGLTYKWKKGSNFISGATLSNYTATTGGNYKVQVTNSNGCSKTSGNVAVSVPCKEGESILPENNFNVKIYPNPSSGNFIVKVFDENLFGENSNNEEISISIFDAMGRTIKKDTAKIISAESSFQISNLSPGIYLIMVKNNERIVSEKIIVE